MSSAATRDLLAQAVREGAGPYEIDGPRAREIAPIVACSSAVGPLVALGVATHGVELALDGTLDPCDLGEAKQVLAELTFLGHGALISHADRYGYDPARRLQSILSAHAPTQVEGVIWFVEAGAGLRCLQPCVAALTEAVAIAMVEAKTGEFEFVDAAAAWTGASLALYAIARSVTE